MTPNETENQAPARQRIAKLMARVGLCSRRDAEAWIVDGRVSVNGAVLTSPAFDVGPDDKILVDGAPLPQAEKTRLFLFHKPRGLVTSDHDPEGRATVADYLREHWPDGPRVVTIGRLDINTEGLLLLTNDGGLARLLELPKTGWVRRYRVRAKGETDQSVLDGLADGITIDGIDYAGIEAKLDRQQGANVWLTMGLREGKNREVKRVLEAIGLEVNRLIRLSFGPFQLGDVPEGAVEEVRTRVLRDQLGPALAAAAGVAFEDAPPVESKPAHADRKAGRTAGAERTNKAVRPAPNTRRDGARQRDERPRGGDRPLRRARENEAPPPIRERPTAGTRKHVTTLRAEEAEATKRGPRRRIERGDLTDRRDRKVTVERLVGTQSIEPTRARTGRPARRDDARPAAGKPGRRPASPSAMAKRARVARSGGRHEDTREETRQGRPGAREERPSRVEGQRHRSHTAEAGGRGDAPRGAARPRPARDGQDRTRPETRSQRPRGERPERGERAARSESGGQRREGTKFEGKRPGGPRASRDARAAADGGPRRDNAPRPDRPGKRPGGPRPPGGARGGAPRSAGGRPGGKPRGPGGGGRGKSRPER